ncbi:MAG: hypothetical protein ACRDOK_25670 [Streptosporangiaceae bacterium]
MAVRTLPVAAVTDDMLHPTYWLVSGLAWQGPTAEAAMAVAPGLIPRNALSDDTCQVLGCADLHARKRGLRVVFFSDLTRMFTSAGSSWLQLGVDWESALRELRDGQFPAMFLTISEPAYLIICNPIRCEVPTRAAATETAADECEPIRRALAGRLVSDWPAYLQSAADVGRLALA